MTVDDAAVPPTGGHAARLGLIRSVADRRLAGVGTALGRATGTDPLLWRVLLAVLTVFAGAGVVLYLLCWLVFPAEGDQTSPLGAMLSAKTSSTSRFVTALLVLVLVLVAIVTFISTDGRPFLVFGLSAVLVFVLARRRAAEPAAGPASAPPTDTTAPLSPQRYPAPFTPPIDTAVTPPAHYAAPPDTAATPPPQRYTAPFAPHGPYANRTLDLPAEAPPPPEPPPPPVPARGQRSALGLVTFSLVVIVIGLAAILDMLSVPVAMGTTLAVALLVCGGGLLVGTWWGRARSLIPLGIVLSLGLAAVSMFGQHMSTVPFESQHTVASTVESIPPRLTANLGSSKLDLRDVEFADTDEARLSVSVWVGKATIAVPEDLDVVLDVDHERSTVKVNGETIAMAGDGRVDDHTSLGADGEGGGRLTIVAVVENGSLGITR